MMADRRPAPGARRLDLVNWGAPRFPPPTYLSEAVPVIFKGGVPTYRQQQLVNNRPPVREGART